jgi:hypothetical protein
MHRSAAELDLDALDKHQTPGRNCFRPAIIAARQPVLQSLQPTLRPRHEVPFPTVACCLLLLPISVRTRHRSFLDGPFHGQKAADDSDNGLNVLNGAKRLNRWNDWSQLLFK